LERDVAIAEGTGAPLHLDGLSTAVGVAALAAAKARGAPVTGAVALAHLIFNEVDMGGLDTRFRLDPPLRPESDRQALIEALLDGTLDIVASATAPRRPRASTCHMAEAEPGAATLHAFLPALLSLHHADGARLLDLLRVVTLNRQGCWGCHPAGWPSARLRTLCWFEPDAPVVIAEDRIALRRPPASGPGALDLGGRGGARRLGVPPHRPAR
jgi:dihydroorotase